MFINDLKAMLIEALKEFALSRNRGPFSQRIFQCSKCQEIAVSNSKPRVSGCPVDGQHDWFDTKARF